MLKTELHTHKAKDGDIKYSIVPIDSIAESKQFLEDLDDTSLVLFDVDSVLTVPADPVLQPKSFEKHKNIEEELTNSLSRKQKHILNHLIVARRSILVEEETGNIIKDLQQRDIPTFAFTAATPGFIHKDIPPFHKVRYQHLKDLGIDFAKQNNISLDFVDLIPMNDHFPGLKKGILYASGLMNKKGEVLKCFLSKFGTKITKILFFEDKMKHINSTIDMLRKDFPKISFQGIHYRGTKNLLDVSVTENQFRSLLNELIHNVEVIDE